MLRTEDFSIASGPILVIPAKAGIQSSTSCEAHKTFMSCATHAIFGWIPAFAGMTNAGFGR